MKPMGFPPHRATARTLATLLLVTLLAFTDVPWAADGPEHRATLKGVRAVQVLVGNFELDLDRDGLMRDQLQADVEAQLREAGITVTPTRQGFLRVSATALKTSTGTYAYTTQVEFDQVVTLDRDPTISLAAPTWSVSSVGMVGASRLLEVRFTVADLVDDFIEAYLEQNPKK